MLTESIKTLETSLGTLYESIWNYDKISKAQLLEIKQSRMHVRKQNQIIIGLACYKIESV